MFIYVDDEKQTVRKQFRVECPNLQTQNISISLFPIQCFPKNDNSRLTELIQ